MVLAGQVELDSQNHYIIPNKYKNIAKHVYTPYVSDEKITFYFSIREGILGESSGLIYITNAKSNKVVENGYPLQQGEEIKKNWYEGVAD